jgi:hypothetical protein
MGQLHVVAWFRHHTDKQKPAQYAHLHLTADPTGCVTKQSVSVRLQEGLPELQVSS